MAKNMRGENGAGVRVDPAAVSGNKKTAAGWNSWQTLPAGHNKAVTAIRALETHTDAFLAQLAAARGISVGTS